MSRCDPIYGGSVPQYLADDLLPLIVLRLGQRVFFDVYREMLVSHFNQMQPSCGTQL